MISASPKTFEPCGLATGIGSLPHADPGPAVAAVLKYLPECPFWPQLPRRSHLEGMTLQYAPGLPGLVEKDGNAFLDTGERGQAELAAFFEDALSGAEGRFALLPERAAGYGPMEKALAAGAAAGARCVKGHVTGPVTLVTSLKDLGGRDILHDPSFREAVAVHLARNAAWQVKRLGVFGRPVILFLDEPVMEVFGSAYSTLDRETVLELWKPALDAVREAGGLSGIHCCGNTDWALLFECGADIVNFDAYNYTDKITLYGQQAGRFLEGGGVLAWGVVPTDEKARGETAESLLGRLEEGIGAFARQGADRGLLVRRAMITPSCGMGSLSVELSEAILKLLGETSKLFTARLVEGRMP